MKMIPLRKLKAIILYFCSHTDNKFLGKVKLMKLFYFADFGHLKKYGAPITFDTYVKLEHGPIPSTIKNLVDTASDDIDNSELVDTISIEKPEGTDMCRIIGLRKFSEADAKLFSRAELETLKEVCIRFGDKNTKNIEDSSHNEAAWQKTNLLDPIPYTLASDDKDCRVSKEELELLEKIICR
jgi:uncharacterized phage-associated protein